MRTHIGCEVATGWDEAGPGAGANDGLEDGAAASLVPEHLERLAHLAREEKGGWRRERSQLVSSLEDSMRPHTTTRS